MLAILVSPHSQFHQLGPTMIYLKLQCNAEHRRCPRLDPLLPRSLELPETVNCPVPITSPRTETFIIPSGSGDSYSIFRLVFDREARSIPEQSLSDNI